MLTPCFLVVNLAGPALVSPAEVAFLKVETGAQVPFDQGAPPARVVSKDLQHRPGHLYRDCPTAACSSNHSRYVRGSFSRQRNRLVAVLRTATSPRLSVTLPCPACHHGRAPALACTLFRDKRFLRMVTTRMAMVQPGLLHQPCPDRRLMQLRMDMGHLGGHLLQGQLIHPEV